MLPSVRAVAGRPWLRCVDVWVSMTCLGDAVVEAGSQGSRMASPSKRAICRWHALLNWTEEVVVVAHVVPVVVGRTAVLSPLTTGSLVADVRPHQDDRSLCGRPAR